MPRYFFDIIKNGDRRIDDPAGFDCRNDSEAIAKAASLASEIAIVVRGAAGKWQLAVLNGERKEIGSVPIERKGDRHGVGDSAREARWSCRQKPGQKIGPSETDCSDT
jgi:hypothetical protein